MPLTYDAIVIGTGGAGSAALMQLAERGLRVVGLDRFPAGHDRGSSHGQSRVIRQAYFEHPDYVPLLREAYKLWDELEAARGETLFHRVGLLEVGRPDGIIVPGVLRSAEQYRLDVESLSPAEAERRFVGFKIPPESAVVFERNAGYLLVETCVLAHIAEAQRHGAILDTEAAVRDWRVDNNTIIVRTDRQEYQAARLVVTAGSWASRLLRDLQLPLRVLRKHLHWYSVRTNVYHQRQQCPTYFFELGKDFFYGFPQIDDRGVKIAEHSGGEVIDDPLNASRQVDPLDRQRVESFLARCMPQVELQATDHAVCFYTMSPDEHFIIDRHPLHPNVAFAAGLSGHGFKFTSALGRILCDLVVDGKTVLPIDFLRLARLD